MHLKPLVIFLYRLNIKSFFILKACMEFFNILMLCNHIPQLIAPKIDLKSCY